MRSTINLIINEQFGFHPKHSCPQQALRLVKYTTESFKTKKKTVAVFYDVAKAFDKVWHAEREFLKAPRSLPFCTQRHTTTYQQKGVQLEPTEFVAWTERNICSPTDADSLGSKPRESRNLHFRDYIMRVKKTANFYQARLNGMLLRIVIFCAEMTPLKAVTRQSSHAPSTPSCVVRPRQVNLSRVPANSIAVPVMFSSGGLFYTLLDGCTTSPREFPKYCTDLQEVAERPIPPKKTP
ncbi:RNA-directed DNA polymerase from mobile element jockey [Eumeta japonica]|uniref:RNA-directed DNA polymerase from mobile element jockey n=1 Tax=Eumeta variegata TaxID=151549 RepID=A0A4C1YXP1_EUMVA|nr:RNA-directed DNA polymerase from mobile element jockey [Eumeta japonica]